MENERSIPLPSGETLHITFKDEFLDAIRNAFQLAPESDVTDDDVRRYVYYSFKGAVDDATTEK